MSALSGEVSKREEKCGISYVNKRRRNEDAGAEMLAYKEHLDRYLDAFYLLRHDREASSENRKEQDQDYKQ